jgi:hypothetical protein
MDSDEGYRLYRGRCKELSQAACVLDPTLKLVRGHYACPIWNTVEPHWWCTRPDGSIHDPSKDQFPSKGMGHYKPFDGYVECAECGKGMSENAVEFSDSNFAFCSGRCYGRFVGVF